MEAKTPAPRALAAVKAGPPAEPIDKALRITAKVRRAIELLATGKCKTQTEAAEQVGLARESLNRAFAKPHILEFMRQRAIRTIAMAASRADEVKAELGFHRRSDSCIATSAARAVSEPPVNCAASNV